MAQKLSYEQMSEIKNKLSTCKNRMDEILNSEVTTLMNKVGDNSVWSGDSAAETTATLKKLQAVFPEFVQAIEACVTYLGNVEESYRQVEQQISGQAQ